MSTLRRSSVPPAAISWLVGAPQRRVLTVGTQTAGLTEALATGGHPTTLVVRSLDEVPSALPAEVSVVSAQAESLPFDPCSFDVVVSSQDLHTFAPGLALSEFARVLAPGGCLSLMYVVRDDSVPWVLKLRDLLRTVDPGAMSGAYGSESVERVYASPYYPEIERKDFRIWVPADRATLLTMVSRSAATQDEDARDQLLTDVGALYDSYGRAPEPLLLPYKASCWRAWVDHAELSAPIVPPDEGLSIPL